MGWKKKVSSASSCFRQNHGGGAAVSKRLEPQEDDSGEKNRLGGQEFVLGLCD